MITTPQSGLLTWFLTPLILCALILYINGGTCSLNSTPNDRFFEKLFMSILFYSQSFCQKSAEMKSPKKYFSYLVLMSGLEHEPWFQETRKTGAGTRVRVPGQTSKQNSKSISSAIFSHQIYGKNSENK